MSEWNEQFELTVNVGAVAQARRRIREFDHLPAARVPDAELVVSELVSNAIAHSGIDALGTLMVTFRRVDDRLSIEVDDGGAFRRGDLDGERPFTDVARRFGLEVVGALCEDWHAAGGLVSASMAM